MASPEAGPSRHTVYGEDGPRLCASTSSGPRRDTRAGRTGEWYPSPGRTQAGVAQHQGRARLSRRDRRAEQTLESAYVSHERAELEQSQRHDSGPGLGTAIMESAVNAGVMGVAVGLTAYKLWTQGWSAIRPEEAEETDRWRHRRDRERLKVTSSSDGKNRERTMSADRRLVWARRRRRPRRPSITTLSRSSRLSPTSTGAGAWSAATPRTGTASASASGWGTGATTPTTGVRAAHRRFASAVSPAFCNYPPLSDIGGGSRSTSFGLGSVHGGDAPATPRDDFDDMYDAPSSDSDTASDETSARLGAMARRVGGLIRSGRAALASPITTPEAKPLREALRDADLERTPVPRSATPSGAALVNADEPPLGAERVSPSPSEGASSSQASRTAGPLGIGLGAPPLLGGGSKRRAASMSDGEGSDAASEASMEDEAASNGVAATYTVPPAASLAPRSVSAPLRPSALPRPSARALSTSRARYEQVIPPLPWRRQNGSSRWIQAPVSPVRASTEPLQRPEENLATTTPNVTPKAARRASLPKAMSIVPPPVPPPPAIYAQPRSAGQAPPVSPEPCSTRTPNSPRSPSSRIPRPSPRSPPETPRSGTFPRANATPSPHSPPPPPLQDAARDAARWHSVRGSPAPMPGLVASRASLFTAPPASPNGSALGASARSRIPVRHNMGSVSSLSSVG